MMFRGESRSGMGQNQAGPEPALQRWQLPRFGPRPNVHCIHRRTPSSLLPHSQIHTSVLPAQQFGVIADAAAPLPLPG